MTALKNQSEHILQLSKELLDDIELSRLDSERLLLKCARLARLVGSEEVTEWIQYEMMGYNSSDPVSLKYMALTGRWRNYEKKEGLWGPLAQQEASIIALQEQLKVMRIPNVEGQLANLAIQNVTNAITNTTTQISIFSGVRSRVLAHLHIFISKTYYEKEFESLSETIFEKYKLQVDDLLISHCGNVIQKIPSVLDRLAQADEESISQALNTCRRIIDSFADSIFPPTEESKSVGGNVLKLDKSKPLNRINVYVNDRTPSQSRKQKLRQNLANLYDRISTGVHDDVTAAEAYSLFLNTYLVLGEILQLPKEPLVPVKEESPQI